MAVTIERMRRCQDDILNSLDELIILCRKPGTDEDPGNHIHIDNEFLNEAGSRLWTLTRLVARARNEW